MLNARCGSGRVTALLADRVPRGRVYGVDVAPSMAEHAKNASQHLGDMISMGSDAMRQSAEETRKTAQTMTDHAQKVVESAAQAMGTKPK